MALRRTKSERVDDTTREKVKGPLKTASGVASGVGLVAGLAGVAPVAGVAGVLANPFSATGIGSAVAAGTAGAGWVPWGLGTYTVHKATDKFNDKVAGVASAGVGKLGKLKYRLDRKFYGHTPGFRKKDRALFNERRPLKSHLRSLKSDPLKYAKGQVSENKKTAAALGIGALGTAAYLGYKKLTAKKSKKIRRSKKSNRSSRRRSNRSSRRRRSSRRTSSSRRSKRSRR
jgi:hypothetical protein